MFSRKRQGELSEIRQRLKGLRKELHHALTKTHQVSTDLFNFKLARTDP